MPLTSMRFLVLCIVLAILLPVALFILWRRAPRKSGWATVAFVVGMVVAQAATVSAVAVNVNRDYGFYPDWASLWGTQVVAPPAVQAGTRLGVNAVHTPRRLVSRVVSDLTAWFWDNGVCLLLPRYRCVEVMSRS